MTVTVRAATPADRDLVATLLTRSWGSPIVVAHGVRYDASALPALIAWNDDTPAGLLTYRVDGDGLEIVTFDALTRHQGAGTALLTAAVARAREHRATRVWLITTNDNLDALRFYQRRGLRIVAVSPGAVDESRRLKPSIPLVGDYGIEIHDELTLALTLSRDPLTE
ncbi:GNAT family N-acetyltransferase [Paractinoplanes atraurantiacus]|uniref:Acetyltransferase (GNAT) family protein n=1 Tax=Paractinoplanes atraurantiacus TaxID=1036182 RepID=A0A285IWT8_9ACTN|nr:GNAT family N-acetyltransferase [Actinoplanes atraurantiacus]SNY52505.1 Acetyltransferase (GNAT) family protein [Actinoplanes atraurantiacus]